jgi:protein-S-isoprenylcysteine O-methyltransferase Ste14
MVFLGKWKDVDKYAIKYHFLGWLVKAFFLALMFPYLMNNTNIIINRSFTGPIEHFGKFYDYMYNLIFTIDLAFVSAGYLLTLKIFDTHIRTAEPTFLGWMFALYCYEPFWSALANPKYLKYEDGYIWGHLFAGNSTMFVIWGSIILILFAIFTLSSVAFGMRFSNLTNRGIITNGPYRLMKHPAYVSKNIAWWLISVPFISAAGPADALKHCLLLIGLNLIYYLRAITEERHLSLDPTYVQYANAMNEKGIFSGLYKVIPFLKYDVNRFIRDGKIKKLLF